MQSSARTEETRSVKSLRQKRRTCQVSVATLQVCGGKGVRSSQKGSRERGKDCTVNSQSEKMPLEDFMPGSGMISSAFF